MCDNGVTAIIPPVAHLEKIQVKPDELVVVKFDTDRYDLEDCRAIYQQIIEELPAGVHAIGIPVGIELERTTIEDMIKRLEECKDGILH
jgi:hypothetical protein